MSAVQQSFDLTIFQQVAEQTSGFGSSTICLLSGLLIWDLRLKQSVNEIPNACWKRPPQFSRPFIPDDRQYVVNNYRHFLEQKCSVRVDFRIIRPDETMRWIALKTYPLDSVAKGLRQ